MLKLALPDVEDVASCNHGIAYPTTLPIAAPTRTSVGKCAPAPTRNAPTDPATIKEPPQTYKLLSESG